MLHTIGKRTVQLFILVAVLLTFGNDVRSAGEAWTQWGTITGIQPGWREDTMGIFHSTPLVNPAGCPVTNAGYATDPKHEGHSLFHTVALSAFLNKREVAILVEGPPQATGCIYGKPKLIALNLR